MKTVVINAGPKRRDNNAKLMKSAAEGAEMAGADVDYIDLYSLDLRGCMNCAICKQDGRTGKCYWRDEVSPLIENILAADCLLIGSPIFFSEPTSHYRALMERLIYCIVSYDVGNTFKGKINVGLFYTINFSKEYFEKSVRPNLKLSEDLFKMFNGEVVIYTSCNFTKRDLAKLDEDEVSLKEKEFSFDLDSTFEIGKKLQPC